MLVQDIDKATELTAPQKKVLDFIRAGFDKNKGLSPTRQDVINGLGSTWKKIRPVVEQLKILGYIDVCKHGNRPFSLTSPKKNGATSPKTSRFIEHDPNTGIIVIHIKPTDEEELLPDPIQDDDGVTVERCDDGSVANIEILDTDVSDHIVAGVQEMRREVLDEAKAALNTAKTMKHAHSLLEQLKWVNPAMGVR